MSNTNLNPTNDYFNVARTEISRDKDNVIKATKKIGTFEITISAKDASKEEILKHMAHTLKRLERIVERRFDGNIEAFANPQGKEQKKLAKKIDKQIRQPETFIGRIADYILDLPYLFVGLKKKVLELISPQEPKASEPPASTKTNAAAATKPVPIPQAPKRNSFHIPNTPVPPAFTAPLTPEANDPVIPSVIETTLSIKNEEWIPSEQFSSSIVQTQEPPAVDNASEDEPEPSDELSGSVIIKEEEEEEDALDNSMVIHEDDEVKEEEDPLAGSVVVHVDDQPEAEKPKEAEKIISPRLPRRAIVRGSVRLDIDAFANGAWYVQKSYDPGYPFKLMYNEEGEAKELPILKTETGYEMTYDVLGGSLVEKRSVEGRTVGQLAERLLEKNDLGLSPVPIFDAGDPEVFLEDVSEPEAGNTGVSAAGQDFMTFFTKEKTGVNRLDAKWLQTTSEEGDLSGIMKEKLNGNLLPMVANLRQMLLTQKEKLRPLVEAQVSAKSLLDQARELVAHGMIKPIGGEGDDSGGLGGAYKVYKTEENGEERILFIAKPLDQGPLCVHNSKRKATPWHDDKPEHRVRAHHPLYQDALNEVGCFFLAEECGIREATPRTILAILESDKFHDLMDDAKKSNHADDLAMIKATGEMDKEKICSLQEFVPNEGQLSKHYDPTVSPKIYNSAFLDNLDQSHFEKVNLLMWLTYDNDGNIGNFLCQGNKLIKIDGGLAFPDKNREYNNQLVNLPGAKLPLSHETKTLIKNIPTQKIIDKMRDLGKNEAAIEAFLERVDVLQTLAERENISIEEVDHRMELLGSDTGRLCSPPMSPAELAKSNYSLAEIKEMLNPTLLFPEVWDKDDGDIPDLGKYRLCALLKAPREKAASTKADLRDAIYQAKRQFPQDFEAVQSFMLTGSLIPAGAGKGDAQFLTDPSGKERYVIKKPTADFSCYNNRKGEATPFYDMDPYHRVKKDNPLYRTAQAEAASYQAAILLGLQNRTPVTFLAALKDENGYDILDAKIKQKGTEEELAALKQEVKELIGERDNQPLCSVQVFIDKPGAEELTTTFERWESTVVDKEYQKKLLKEGKEEEHKRYMQSFEPQFRAFISESIELETYAEIQLLQLITWGMDLHLGNLISSPAEEGSKRDIQVIDLGLTFPDKNTMFRNETSDWPQGKNPFPESCKQKIRQFSQEKMADVLKQLKMGSTIDAMNERVDLLKTLVEREEMTMEEINERMALLSLSDEFTIAGGVKGYKSLLEIAGSNKLNFTEIREIRKQLALISEETVLSYRVKNI